MALPSDDILRLSVEDQLELVEAIWESIRAHPEKLPTTEALRAELDRRLEEHRADPSAAEDLELLSHDLVREPRAQVGEEVADHG
jgi:putative addiction module component (TIGR02574 family)